MDSSFISSITKKAFCNSLKSFMPEIETKLDIQIQRENEIFVSKVEYKEKMTMLFSLILGFITMFATIYITIRPDSTNSIVGKVFDSTFPILMVFSVVMITMNGMIAAMKLRHKRLRQEAGIADSESPKQSENNL